MNVPENALRTVSSPSIEREDLVLKRHDHGHVTSRHGHATFSVKNERFTVENKETSRGVFKAASSRSRSY